jgi:tight adherence protein C
METILQFIAGNAAKADGAVLAGAVFFTFMFMFFVVLAVTDLVQRRSDIRKRATYDISNDRHGIALEQGWETAGRSLRFQSYAENSALLARVERNQKQKHSEDERTRLERELVSAGFFAPSSVVWFQAIRMSLLVGLPLTLYVMLVYFGPAMQTSTQIGLAAAGGGIGFLLPGRYLAVRQKGMRDECRDGFPDFMDLMLVCAEAGLSPRAAVDRISREIAQTYPFLGANLYLMSLELRAGSTLGEAMEGLARRTKVEEVTNLGLLLQQSEQLGTSLTDSLRVYSEEMRDKRISRAEEKAHALPVKLTLPLGVYIFPVMLIVIALPIVARLRHAFQ